MDVFNIENEAQIYKGNHILLPCTPQGILTLLDEYKIDMSIKDKIIQSLLTCSNNYVNELLYLYGYNEESISDYKSFIHAINKNVIVS